jgi:hypothetical protein
MKIINNTLSENMIAILRTMIGKRLISYEVNPLFKKENLSLYSVMLNVENEKIELFADIKYFDILDGEDYSFFEIHKEKDPSFDKNKVSANLQKILVNQKIEDIKILTDYYHCVNAEEKLNEKFVHDYAVVFILEKDVISFEHFGLFEEDIDIKYYKKDTEIKFYDNSEYFNGEAKEEGDGFLYHTERNREYKSVTDIHR